MKGAVVEGLEDGGATDPSGEANGGQRRLLSTSSAPGCIRHAPEMIASLPDNVINPDGPEAAACVPIVTSILLVLPRRTRITCGV